MQTPSSRPAATREQVVELLKSKGIQADSQLVLLGVRGYFSKSIGKVGNDRKHYDDAIFVVGPRVFKSFNCNVDPGAFRRGIANLIAGVWKYKIGIHGLSKPKILQYRALVQAANVTVMRDEQGKDTGRFGINIHRGGNTSVSSIGCQTIPPSQWSEFINVVAFHLGALNQSEVTYVLHDAGPEGSLT